MTAWLRAARRRWPAVTPRRLARGLFAGIAVLLSLWVGLGLTPPGWWIDEARFTRPADAFDVVDRHGVVLRHARVSGVDRRWIALREVDPRLAQAFIAAEDGRFRDHDGVDARAILRGAMTMVRPWGRRSGGSTISQQVVKLVYGRESGLLSKLLEIQRARALERTLSKDEILEQYLNRVPFGDRIQGVARASEAYFGHPAGEVTLAEAALLAGIPQAPSATEPRRHLGRAKRRARYVVTRMAALGMIDGETMRQSLDAVPHVVATAPRPDAAPRFVDVALTQWRSGALDRQGGDLATSLDLTLQREVDALLAAEVVTLESRGVTNGAAIVLSTPTGEILAYTGAARRRGPGGSLDLLQRRRQPGSTLKPFVYELFFERGGSAASRLDDISLPRTGAHGSSFDAEDYDGRERGPVRARVALSASLNLAALDVAARVGQDRLIERLRALGLRGVGASSRYGAAAVLGGLDVAPIDLAAAYATLARGGIHLAPTLAAPDRAAGPARRARVMTAAASEVTRDILFDSRARAEAFGADLVDLAGSAPFGLKTGTSSGFRDAWAATFDDAFTVVVWMGDPEGRPLAGVSGFEASAPVAARILAAARDHERAAGPTPRAAAAMGPGQGPGGGQAPRSESAHEHPPLVSLAICAATGLRPGPGCTHTLQERFAAGAWPTETCEAHDDRGDVVLPLRYAGWVGRHHPSGVARAFTQPADGSDAEVVVREPRDGTRLLIDRAASLTTLPLRARVGAIDLPPGDARWLVDGAAADDDAWRLVPGVHEIVAEWRGKRSHAARVTVEIAAPR